MSLNKLDIKSLSKDQLVSWLHERNICAYRAAQILKWMYRRQGDDFGRMTDLNKKVRKLLAHHFTIDRLEKMQVQTALDGCQKYLFRLQDGNLIESVLIPERSHYTLCISTQVGCAQGCRFCHTARGGFMRNLTKSEIVSQVRDIRHELKGDLPLTNIVFMGMGEPLANYRNVLEAVKVLTDGDTGLGFSRRKVTVSTAGLLSRLDQLGRDTQVNLAVSLNATDNATRSRLMPINRQYPLEQLLHACRQYKLRPHRRITFEYILIAGINDSQADAKRLAKMLRPLRSKINLIPLNEFEGCEFKRPGDAVVERFQEVLIQNNYTAIIRKSKGADIAAACGQLRGRYNFDTRFGK